MSETIVRHKHLGKGIIIKSRHKGYEVFVKFRNDLSRWVKSYEIEIVRDVPTKCDLMVDDQVSHPTFGVGKVVALTPSDLDWNVTVNFNSHGTKILKYSYARLVKHYGEPTQETKKRPTYRHSKTFEARRVIEALRLGIVPHDYVSQFTFGREEETITLRNWLDNEQSHSLVLLGGYGTGKTHLLQYTFSLALKAGFAVCSIAMDPNENPFYKPKRVYRRLMATLRYRDRQDGKIKKFRNLVRTTLNHGYLSDHAYFSLLRNQDSQMLWEWIEASETIVRPVEVIDDKIFSNNFLPGLYDYSTAANLYCNLISTIGWATQNALGLKGLVLLFDEAESISMHYYTYQDSKSINFITALMRTAQDRPELLGHPRGSHLEYCKAGHSKNVPFIYKKPTNLKLLFAFTSLQWNFHTYWQDNSHARVPELADSEKLDLSSLNERDLRKTVRRISEIYLEAYNEWKCPEDILKKIEGRLPSTRAMVKKTVEVLDLLRVRRADP